MKRIPTLALATQLALASATASAQDVHIPVEGFVTDETELPVNGPIDVTVRVYDAADGGAVLFEERHPRVFVDRGFFYLAVGSEAHLEPRLFDEVVPNAAGPNRYLGLTFGDATSEQAPRVKIGFAPFAVRALNGGVSEQPGPAGPRGGIGPRGGDGPAGPRGATGVRGATGPAGIAGPAGAAGPIGAAGPRGPTGPGGTGPEGPAGVAGPRGVTGATGPGGTGPEGPVGPAGPVGSIGPTGPMGPAGVQGSAGPAGPRGARGLTGLQGPPGPSGATGTQGVRGLTGARGATGSDGATGVAGPEGPQGPPGYINVSGTSHWVLRFHDPNRASDSQIFDDNSFVRIHVGGDRATPFVTFSPGREMFPGRNNYVDSGKSGYAWRGVTSYRFTTVSDANAKRDVQPLEYGLDEVMRMRPVRYEYKEDEGVRRVGLLAQDVAAIVPEVVDVPKDSSADLGLYYSDLVPVLVRAIQDQQRQLDALA